MQHIKDNRLFAEENVVIFPVNLVIALTYVEGSQEAMQKIQSLQLITRLAISEKIHPKLTVTGRENVDDMDKCWNSCR